MTNRTERLDPATELETSSGRVLVVEASRPFGSRFIVSFVGVEDRSSAEAIRGLKLLAVPIDDEGAIWVHEVVGASVFDASGRDLGVVRAVVANPASDLMELSSGALIPLVFVVETSQGRVVVDIPEGLVE